MARQQMTRSKRQSSTAPRPQSSTKRVAKKPVRKLEAVRDSARPARKPQPFDVTHIRFHFASLLRLSDKLVAKAVSAYDRLFALDQREEADIYLEMGKDLSRQDKLDEALEALRKVLATRPDHADALYEVGVIHLRRGAPHAAAEVLGKAKTAGKRSHRLHLHLADALARQEKLAEALVELESALELSPNDSDGHYRRGMMLDRLERYADAVQAFETAIRLQPGEVRFHQSLGFTLETLGRRSDAIKCFKRALELERPVTSANDVMEP